MKKNKMMRLASLLLVAVMLTTCTISGTYAKYVTTGTGTDTARVAKWGVTVTPTGTIFSKQYATDDTSRYSGANSVVTSNEDKLVAPGTTGGNTLVQLSGIPEVAYRVDYTATLALSNWTISADLNGDGVDDFNGEYCPIIFTVEGTPYKIGDVGIEDTSDLITKVKTAIEDCSASYDPNLSLADASVIYPTVTWEWKYSDVEFDAISENDIKDTALGNAAANGQAATIQLEVVTTVTQID